MSDRHVADPICISIAPSHLNFLIKIVDSKICLGKFRGQGDILALFLFSHP
jgi:hypothetical protein